MASVVTICVMFTISSIAVLVESYPAGFATTHRIQSPSVRTISSFRYTTYSKPSGITTRWPSLVRTTETQPVTRSTKTAGVPNSSAGCVSILPWILFGVSCIINVILAILLAVLLVYFFRLRHNDVNQSVNKAENAAPDQTMSSYLNTTISDHLAVDTSNVDGIDYENVEAPKVKPTNQRKENRYVTPRHQTAAVQQGPGGFKAKTYENVA